MHHRKITLVVSFLSILVGVGLSTYIPYSHAKKRCKGNNSRRVRRRNRFISPSTELSELSTEKRWTILVFMIGDSALEASLINSQRKIETAGAAEDLNLPLFVCIHGEGNVKYTKKMEIESSYFQYQYLNELEARQTTMCDSGILAGALEWMFSYEADHYGVIIVAHGLGPLNVRYTRPDTYDRWHDHILSDNDVRHAFEEVSKKGIWKQLSFIGFDACHMSTLEVAASLRPFARYMIASEQTIRGEGWPYHTMFGGYYEYNKDPHKLVEAFVEAYGKYYEGYNIDDYTLAVLDLKLIDSLTQNVVGVADVLISLLDDKDVDIRSELRKASEEAIRFDEETFVDLYSWYDKLSLMFHRLKSQHPGNHKFASYQELVLDGRDLLTQIVMYITYGQCFRGTYGLAIYLPFEYISEGYTRNYWVSEMKEWLTFLRKYLDEDI